MNWHDGPILWLDKYSPGWLVFNLQSNPALFVRETIAKDANRASIELGAPREAKEHRVALAENLGERRTARNGRRRTLLRDLVESIALKSSWLGVLAGGEQKPPLPGWLLC